MGLTPSIWVHFYIFQTGSLRASGFVLRREPFCGKIYKENFKKGNYKIDIPKLIENDKTYTHDMNIRGFYMFSEPGGNKKMVHADSEELIEFLEKNDIDLDRCITYK